MEVSNKKSYTYILLSLFVFAFCIGNVNASEYINYNGINMTEQEYNNLLNLGFTEDEIYYISEESFNLNKDTSAELVSKNQKYYKTIYTDLNGSSYTTEITEDEYDTQSMIDPRGTVNTTYKTIVSTMSKLTSTFRYKVSVAWNRMPSKRSYDIIGVGFEDDVSIATPVYFTYHYCYSDGSCTNSTLNYGKKSLSTGGSTVYKLPSDDIVGLSSTLYYDVEKDTTDTITYLEICGDYSHATSTVTSTQYSGHSINITGILLGGYAGYYDATPCAMAAWSGSW